MVSFICSLFLMLCISFQNRKQKPSLVTDSPFYQKMCLLFFLQKRCLSFCP
uniref:Uncharacterized protein n=1 Tax=Arundo donax TaxID=35708 RepID=A0A0A9G2H2_ARUDO